jgi:head-tail adaptor
MFNKTIDLVTDTYTADKIGQQVSSYSYREVFTDEKGVGMTEFHLAGQNGIKPEKCFIVRSCEYEDETKVRYPAGTGKIYTIYRVYPRADEFTELYCQVRAGNG